MFGTFFGVVIPGRRGVGLTCCEDVHTAYDAKANREIEVGELPASLHVKGRVAWYVYQGPYSELSVKGWDVFWRKFAASNMKMEGSPGDVYVCSPGCHKEDHQAKMLTIMWTPVA
jgi:hypothetical protein